MPCSTGRCRTGRQIISQAIRGIKRRGYHSMGVFANKKGKGRSKPRAPAKDRKHDESHNNRCHQGPALTSLPALQAASSSTSPPTQPAHHPSPGPQRRHHPPSWSPPCSPPCSPCQTPARSPRRRGRYGSPATRPVRGRRRRPRGRGPRRRVWGPRSLGRLCFRSLGSVSLTPFLWVDWRRRWRWGLGRR